MNTKAITAKELAELKKVLANWGQVKSPMVKPNNTAAATPTAADSVGVAMPANKLPNTAKISTKMGHTAMVARSVAAFGRLDCAFNNAGISPRDVGPAGQRTHEMSRASFDDMLAVNLTGVFLCMKYEIAQMLAQGGGSIVNTASIAGLVGLPSASNYVASKHGVVGITKTAAMEYASDKIRVNCVNPGYIKTPMTDPTMAERYDALMTKVPMSRLGLPEEIAEAVVWMLSDKASFMTGASQIIDGGYYAA
jgi:NAD(P)-dependent dehydrogenase (short-subunit alcohol dehydrogenase family)